MSKFSLGDSLAEVLKNVPDSGTGPGREQITYIPLANIDSDGNNFYSLEGIEDLAANIELVGLQQPLRVRASEGFPGRYLLTSGHRRRAAIGILDREWYGLHPDTDEDSPWSRVACIVEQPAGSDALQELRLIYANSDTRRMSSADLAKQAERVEALLYQLKEEGYEFPGRMRDHVAEACKVSKTKLGNLKVIRDGLSAGPRELWEAGKLNEAKALALAREEPETQERVYSALGPVGLSDSTEDAVSAFIQEAKREVKAHDAPRQMKLWTPEELAVIKAEEDAAFIENARLDILPNPFFQRCMAEAASKNGQILAAKNDIGLHYYGFSSTYGYIQFRPDGIEIRDDRRDNKTRKSARFILRSWSAAWELLAAAALQDLSSQEPKQREKQAASPEPGWIPGNQPPDRDRDAAAVFDCGGQPIRTLCCYISHLAHWFFGSVDNMGARIEAECLKYILLPEEKEETEDDETDEN